MEHFEHCLELLGMIGKGYATRSSLVRCKHGFFADKLDFYIKQGIICCEKSNDERNDKFYLTAFGLKLWRQEITVKDIERGLE